MLGQISLFNGMQQAMGHAHVSQRVISQNISHADTPDYKAREVANPNFRTTLGRYMNKQTLHNDLGDKMPIDKTSDSHITQRLSVGRKNPGEESRYTYEVAPSNNAVVLEEQILGAAENMQRYQLVSTLYDKHMSMLRAAMAPVR